MQKHTVKNTQFLGPLSLWYLWQPLILIDIRMHNKYIERQTRCKTRTISVSLLVPLPVEYFGTRVRHVCLCTHISIGTHTHKHPHKHVAKNHRHTNTHTHGSFARNDLQYKASYGFSPPCIQIYTLTTTALIYIIIYIHTQTSTTLYYESQLVFKKKSGDVSILLVLKNQQLCGTHDVTPAIFKKSRGTDCLFIWSLFVCSFIDWVCNKVVMGCLLLVGSSK